MSPLRVLFFTIGSKEVASSRTRVYEYLPYLRQKAIRCRLIFYIAPWQSKKVINMGKVSLFIKLCGKVYSFFKTIIFIILAPQYDILFIQRVLLPLKLQKLILLFNKNIIFDFDDAVYLADQWKSPLWRRHKFLKRFQYIVKKSVYVIVSNEVLMQEASKFNSKVIRLPTPVDIQKLIPKYERGGNGKVVVGWMGSPASTRYLEPLRETFESLAARYPFLKMKLIGATPLYDWKIDMTVKQWSLKDEVEDLQGFDIGIMPLTDDEWSRGKGGYKLLQYMAVSIPCVASPVGINCELIQSGINGFLASSPEQWQEKLSILIEDRKLRDRMGIEGRKKAKALYSYQVNITKLIDVLKSGQSR